MISCNSQKFMKINSNCDITETSNLAKFDSLYINIDSTKLFRNKLQDFDTYKNGVFFCQFLPNKKYGKFTIVKNINTKLVCFNSGSSYNEEVILKESDIELLLKNISSVNKMYYYEQCDEYISNDTFYLMLIKKDGDIVSKYFSHGTLNFDKTEENNNINAIKIILEVMYRNSFK